MCTGVPAAIDLNSVSGDYEPSYFVTGQILQYFGLTPEEPEDVYEAEPEEDERSHRPPSVAQEGGRALGGSSVAREAVL